MEAAETARVTRNADRRHEWRKANPEKARATYEAWYEKNRERVRAASRSRYEANRQKYIDNAKKNYKTWAKKNPERLSELRRNYANVRRYGITPQQFDEMFLEQDGKCAICEQPPRKRQLAIDHDHATGRVRQLLCVNCNAMLGHAQEDARVLQLAIEYLRSHASRRAA